MIRVSDDEGKTFALERLISEDYAAYSDLTILKDKTVGVLWERGVERGYQFITFTRLNREWLEQGSGTGVSPVRIELTGETDDAGTFGSQAGPG